MFIVNTCLAKPEYPELFSQHGWEQTNAHPIPSCFHNPDESTNARLILGYSTWMRVRRLLSQHSPYLRLFNPDESTDARLIPGYSTWMRVRRLLSQHSPYPRLVNTDESTDARPIPGYLTWMRVHIHSTYPRLFNLDKSKKATKPTLALS
jgi:hypothetical protein